MCCAGRVRTGDQPEQHILESAGRVVEISAVVCTGRFFETRGDDFFSALRNELGRRLGQRPEILCGNDRAMHLAGAWDLARSATEQPGVSVALGRTSAELRITAPHPIRYSTLHPDPIINTSGKIDMDPMIRWCFFSMLVGFTFLFSWLQSLRVRVFRLERRLAA